MSSGHGAAGAERPAPAVDAAVFRHVIGTFMTGVVVLTTADGGRRHGMTVSVDVVDPRRERAQTHRPLRTYGEVPAGGGAFSVRSSVGGWLRLVGSVVARR